jgi:hypothetical protein
MNSKFGFAETPAGLSAARPNVFRATLELASRMLSFWPPRSGAARPRSSAETEPVVEESIEEILARMPGEHLCWQNVGSRYGHIDHVVLSRAWGIFLIETKAHSGRVSVVDCRLRVNGKPPERDFVAQILRHTYWLIEELRSLTGLEPAITPLLVFTKASVDSGRPLKGIPITGKSALLATLEQNGEPLPAALWEAREAIAALLHGASSEAVC